ncbi:MAG: hypothetical protein GWP69_17515 [Gammaproteobacteria bacterium]|nr:hypothetical protein [Gammaproteobacteria bacterium]
MKSTYMPTTALILTVLLLLGAAGSRAEELKSSLERNPIHAGESVRLVLELRRAAGGLKPDLSPLDDDFQILHTSANTQIEFVQGLQSAITRWSIELTPKREGALTIPGISVGQFQSPELILQVLAARPETQAGNRDIFLEAEVSPNPVYVQAQMRYVVRLLRSVDVVDGTLTEPSATNAVLRRLGRDISYTTNRDGRSYRVLERRYALFPQISGELVVSPVEFEGEVVDPSQASSGLSRLFARGKRVRLRTPIVRATAIAPPADYPGQTWLPAKNVQISEEWSKDPDTLLAGEPLTRTLRLQAVGLSAEQLPEIAVTVAEGVKEYGDQPIMRTTADTDWVHGVREQRIALVPGNEGSYTLPEIRIDWWDTERNAPRQATIPARILRVAAGTLDNAAALTDGEASTEKAPPPATLRQRLPLWQGVSALLAIVWLITFIAWRRARALGRTTAETRDNGVDAPHSPPASLEQACLADDARAATEALLQWGARNWPEQPPRSLPGLAQRLSDAQLRAQLTALDRALYAPARDAWRGEQLWRRARTQLRRPVASAPREVDGLAELYPRRP